MVHVYDAESGEFCRFSTCTFKQCLNAEETKYIFLYSLIRI